MFVSFPSTKNLLCFHHFDCYSPLGFNLVATHVYVKALSVEEFAVRLAKHFTSLYQQGDMVEKSTAILQEATSQLPQETSIEDVIVPKDADVQIVTEVLDQKFGRRHGKAGVRETSASSSRLSTGEVNSLKEEVTTLRGQLVA
nr:uncharacterized protein LOC103416008 [Malus domestica]